MQWMGKAIGGVLGYAAAGPVGSLLGIFVGHQFDLGIFHRLVTGTRPNFRSQKTQQLFFEISFATMGRIAKVDGRVSEEEVRAARRIMSAMRLTSEQVGEAIKYFTAGKQKAYPIKERIQDLHAIIGNQRVLARAFVEIQVRALIAAGSVRKNQRELLSEIAGGLGIGSIELAQIEVLVRSQFNRASGQSDRVSLEEAYHVLGVLSSATDREIKTAYRRLMNQHHPDKLVARGLPKSMTEVAEKKTQEIRAAYEHIKRKRNIK